MKDIRLGLWLAGVIAVLALAAAGTGVFWQGEGAPATVTTARGDAVQVWGRGLYRYDGYAAASQAIAQDVVTLVLGVPLLLVAVYFTARGSLRGRLVLAGTLGYLLYTYSSIAFITAFNPLYLVYVTLFSLCLISLILVLASFDLAYVQAQCAAALPRRWVAGFCYVIAAFLTVAWLGRIVPALTTGAAPEALEVYSTPVIQTMDLGLIVPLALITGTLLLRRAPLGTLLAALILLKGFTMSAALIAMIIGQALAGVAVPVPLAAMFTLIGVADAALTVAFLRGVREAPRARRPALTPVHA